MTFSTASSTALYSSLRALMLAYIAPNGDRLRDFIGSPEPVYVRAAPRDPVFPYVTLLLDRTTTPGYNTYRETARLEVQIIGRPESQLPNVESAMDIVDLCMLSLLQSTNGLIWCRNRTRYTEPQFTDPAEANVIAVRSTYDLSLWPTALTVRLS